MNNKIYIWIIAILLFAGGEFQIHAAETVTVGFVANAGNNNVQVIDLKSGKTLAKLYTGTAPWRLQLSPDQRELWVQHWYSETTVVVDLADLGVLRSLPERGPGIFNAKGDRFWTYSWPGSIMVGYDTRTLEPKERRQTESRFPYELALAWEDQRLYVGQYDPISKTDRRVHDHALSYSVADPNGPGTSIPVGGSPARMRLDPTGEYLMVANWDGQEITLINENNARARITLAPGPRDIIFGPKGNMVAFCWEDEARESDILTMNVDWSERPWPKVTPALGRKFKGGLVRAQMDPSATHFYALDQVGRRLIRFEVATLEESQSIPVGDVPYDFMIARVPKRERDRWAEKGLSRRRLEEILSKVKAQGEPYHGIQFLERVSVPVAEDMDRGDQDGDDNPSNDPRTHVIQILYQSPDRMKLQFQNGGSRLASGGSATALTPEGRYYGIPRQDLIYLLYALYSLPMEELVRHLAGDVQDSPFLKNGIAVDILGRVREEGHEFYVIGAQKKGEMVSQLWIDRERWVPVSLVEKFPVMEARSPHQQGGLTAGIAETKVRYEKVKGRYQVPMHMVRLMEGREVGRVELAEIEINPSVPSIVFDLSRLGGLGKKPEKKNLARTRASKDGPGQVVPGIGNEHVEHPALPHAPYNSNPPTSGPHTPYLAKWGVHSIPIPPEEQVHHLEDGGVLLQYNCPKGCEDIVQRLSDLADRFDRVVVAPYPLMDDPLALTAWERIELLDHYDEDRIVRFIEAYQGVDHHPTGSARAP